MMRRANLTVPTLFLSGVLALLLSGCRSTEQSGAAPTDMPTAAGVEAEATAPEPAVADATPPPTLPAAPPPTAVPTEAPEAGEDAAPAPTPGPAAEAAPPVDFEPVLEEFPVPAGSRPHDVAPAPDGSVWYTAQRAGALGRLDPATGETTHIPLGAGSAPHGVIVGPDGAPWITDSGLNAIVRVDPATAAVAVFPLPADSASANLNTATFAGNGILWFTGQNGFYGRVDPATGQVEAFAAPRGRGPYGITSTPGGDVYYASLAGSHIARIDLATAAATPLEPPTPGQGARRVWSDSQGRIWVSEWDAGQLALFEPETGAWREWPLPGDRPQAYAVYVDEQDKVWVSDFGGNALVRFDPVEEAFEVFPLPSPNGNVRQILGRPGEIWGAESGVDKLVVIRTAPPAAADGQSLLLPENNATLPASTLFEVAWADRSPFRAGLIEAEQDALAQFPGASVYHLDVVIEPDLIQLAGREEVLYTNQEDEPLSEIYFRLFPNLASGATEIEAVSINDQPVESGFELNDSALRVPLSPALAPGEQIVIRLDFTVRAPNGEGGNYGTFASVDGVLALAHFYPMIPVYDDEGWNVEIAPGIGDVVYADTGFYLVRVTAPAGQTLVASGVEIERDSLDERQVVTFAAGPMRDFYLAVSDRYAVTSRAVGQTTINSYAPPDLSDGNDLTLEYAAKALETFDERFGRYPYTEFDLVSTTTFALGVEYPGMAAILVDLYDAQGRVAGAPASVLLEGVVAHEVAHQWFYGLVGNDQVDEPWLDEAMAQFATIVYYSDVYGPAQAAGFRQSLERRWDRVGGADIPIGMPVRDYSSQEYSAIVYGRGPLFVEALSEALGPAAFEAFVQDYYQAFRWGIASGDDFKQLAERHCDCDLTMLFEEWVYGETDAG
jgi:virginiamycin B lyase